MNPSDTYKWLQTLDQQTIANGVAFGFGMAIIVAVLLWWSVKWMQPPSAPLLDAEVRHRQRHAQLHAALDELVADFLLHNFDATPSYTPISKLLQWSHRQTVEPTPTASDFPSKSL